MVADDVRPSFQLTYFHDGAAVDIPFVNQTATLGRDPECAIVFPESVQGVSRLHATIFWRNGEWWIRDENSSNGTFLDQSRVSEHQLHNGVTIKLGTLPVKFKTPAPSIRRQATSTDDDNGGSPAATIESPVGTEDSVAFDASTSGKIRMSINLASWRSKKGPATVDAVEHDNEAEAGTGTPEKDASWGIQLFSGLGHVLLSATELDDVLEKIMDLVAQNIPSQRAVLCLYEESDQRLVPVVVRTGEERAGEVIHISRSITDLVIEEKSSLLVADTTADSRFANAASIQQLNIRSAMCTPIIHEGSISGLIYVDSQDSRWPFLRQHLEILTSLGIFSAIAVEQSRLRERVEKEQQIRRRLSRYSSPSVVEQIISSSTDITAAVRDVSVLFADLTGFTRMSENMDPGKVVAILNSIFQPLAETVFRFDGTLDKFIGDAILAFFGAPFDQENHAELAVRTALEMQRDMHVLNNRLFADAPIQLKIGINSGSVIVGDIGSENRKDYTVIGDAVNIASRLESSVAKPGQVVIGPSTYSAVADLFDCSPLPPTSLRGKAAPLRAYLVDGVR